MQNKVIFQNVSYIFFFFIQPLCPRLPDVVESWNLAQRRKTVYLAALGYQETNFCEIFFCWARKTGQKMQVVIFFDFDTELWRDAAS